MLKTDWWLFIPISMKWSQWWWITAVSGLKYHRVIEYGLPYRLRHVQEKRVKSALTNHHLSKPKVPNIYYNYNQRLYWSCHNPTIPYWRALSHIWKSGYRWMHQSKLSQYIHYWILFLIETFYSMSSAW